MVKPTLLVLAAGMGSRYGSLKQMDGVGPNNEAIIDYSVYDAIRAGFGKVVFVIRHSFEKEFREVFSAERFGGRIAVEFVFQELDYLPEGASVPEGRVKPWGTNHAVMMAADAVHEPFAVINADDFYGAEAYQTIGDYLSQLGDSKNRYCMVAYDLNRTLSDNGTVSRGVPARAPFGGPVARRHLQGGQTRADGLDREDDRRGQIPPQSLGLVPGVIIRGGPKAAPYLLSRIVLLFSDVFSAACPCCLCPRLSCRFFCRFPSAASRLLFLSQLLSRRLFRRHSVRAGPSVPFIRSAK